MILGRPTSLALLLVLALWPSAAGAVTLRTIGSLPSSRDTASPIAAGSHLRAALDSAANFGATGAADPNIAFTYSAVGTSGSFTGADLAGINIFLLNFDGGNGFSLSAGELNAVEAYVRGGGNLVVFADYSEATRANTVAGRFGVTYAGTAGTDDWTTQTVAGLTTGAFGNVAAQLLQYSRNNASTITSAGLGTVASRMSGSPTTFGQVFFPTGAFAAGAGGMWFVNDAAQDPGGEMWFDYGQSYTHGAGGSIGANPVAWNLSLNAIDYLANNGGAQVPEPGLAALALGALGILGRRRRGQPSTGA